jgi:gamma-glutamyltranspeptidase
VHGDSVDDVSLSRTESPGATKSFRRAKNQGDAVGSRGMIVATAHPFAIHAGLEVLKHNGGAADAALI